MSPQQWIEQVPQLFGLGAWKSVILFIILEVEAAIMLMRRRRELTITLMTTTKTMLMRMMTRMVL